MMLTRLLRLGWERIIKSGFFAAAGGFSGGCAVGTFCASDLFFSSSLSLIDSNAAILEGKKTVQNPYTLTLTVAYSGRKDESILSILFLPVPTMVTSDLSLSLLFKGFS